MERALINVLVVHFGLKNYNNSGMSISDFGLKDIETALSARIKYLIDYDRERLMVSLYRIDVDEVTITNIFKHAKSDLIPIKIARLIISRVLQKIEGHKTWP